MRRPVVDRLSEECENLTDLATELLDKLPEEELQEWMSSTPTQALVLLLESNILSQSLAWREGSLFRRTQPTYNDKGGVFIPADPEAEQRSRHYVEAFDTVLSYLSDFNEWITPEEDKEEEENA